MPSPHRIPLTKFPSVRRLLSEAGNEIPDMNSITQAIKFKLGFAEEGEPIPEILKNYMDVSSTPPANHPPTAADPSTMLSKWLSLVGHPSQGVVRHASLPPARRAKEGEMSIP